MSIMLEKKVGEEYHLLSKPFELVRNMLFILENMEDLNDFRQHIPHIKNDFDSLSKEHRVTLIKILDMAYEKKTKNSSPR